LIRTVFGIVAAVLWIAAFFMPLHGDWGIAVLLQLLIAATLAGVAATRSKWWAALSFVSMGSIPLVFWGVWK